MADHETPLIETPNIVVSTFAENRATRGSQSSTSSAETTPTTTPTQEISSSVLESSLPRPDQSRGRPRYKRQQPSKRYFTPPSRFPSPARPDLMLEVESVPQDPDIFADAETDYFSSTEKLDGPRAYRRHFFDAMPSIDSQTASNRMVSLSIDATIARK